MDSETKLIKQAVETKGTNRNIPLILVVDDDKTTTRTIVGLLNCAGFATACAFNVSGALNEICELKPDLILLDVSLPDGSGLDLCRQIMGESNNDGAPVIFISSHEDVSTKVQGFEAGGVDYVTKPVAGAEVVARVRTHLRLKQAYERLAELQIEQIERLAAAQEKMMPLPKDLPEARFQVSVHQSLKAGGDFYDVIVSGNQVVDYLVADSSGHDLAASFWTAALKSLVAEYANPVNPPKEILRTINSALCKILPSGAFFTLIYGRLNRRTGHLCLINAGHPPAIIISNQNPEPVIVHQQGDVVGAFNDAVFGHSELNLKPGDRFFLYTDGLIETGGSHGVGIHQLAAACAAQQGVTLEVGLQSILGSIAGSSIVQDDKVLMGVDV